MPSASPNTSDSDIEQDLLASAYEASDSAVTAGKHLGIDLVQPYFVGLFPTISPKPQASEPSGPK